VTTLHWSVNKVRRRRMRAVAVVVAEVVAQVEVVEAAVVALLRRPVVLRAEPVRSPQYLERRGQIHPMPQQMPGLPLMQRVLVVPAADAERPAVVVVVEDVVVPLLRVELLLPQPRP